MSTEFTKLKQRFREIVTSEEEIRDVVGHPPSVLPLKLSIPLMTIVDGSSLTHPSYSSHRPA